MVAALVDELLVVVVGRDVGVGVKGEMGVEVMLTVVSGPLGVVVPVSDAGPVLDVTTKK